MENLVSPKHLTDEERLALAAKLDRELDEFINSLEKKRYSEGWPEDRWQEEMDKHPFFMKKAPEPGDDVHPMFEGLQKLKYDPDENSAQDLALNYKEDGNFYIKHRKYRMAIYSYTEGIRANCENPEINAMLYNNRSAAHFFLKNYRSGLLDAQKALDLKPDYQKSRWRAVQCANFLQKFDLCISLCEEILESDESNEDAIVLIERNKAKKLENERNERKQTAVNKKYLKQFNSTVNAIRQRGVKFYQMKENDSITEKVLLPTFQPLEGYRVNLLDDNVLVWPAAFAYPEFMFADFQQQLREDVRMKDCIAEILLEPLQSDINHLYRPDNVAVYYENPRAASAHKVNQEKTIREIITEPGFLIKGGSLLFYIVPKESEIEHKFINEQRKEFFINDGRTIK